MKRLTTLIVAGLLFAFSQSIADPGLVVYRGVDGELTDASVQNLKTLRNIAAREGRITIWVDFDIPFEVNPELRTPEVIAENEAARQQAKDEIIAPLVASGQASEEEIGGPGTQAPGCLVSVSQLALRTLARNPKVKHIGHFPDES